MTKRLKELYDELERETRGRNESDIGIKEKYWTILNQIRGEIANPTSDK